MTGIGILQILFFIACVLLFIKPLGRYIAKVYSGQPVFLSRLFNPVEYFIYRITRIQPNLEMGWQTYLKAMLAFNCLGWLIFYLLLRCQAFLPFNPLHIAATRPDLAFNTAASFVTNTNWQPISSTSCMSFLTFLCGQTVQNFLSAANGLALLMAFIRGIKREETRHLGNYWVDMVRGVLYLLLPLSVILAILLTSLGVVQTLQPTQTVQWQPQHTVAVTAPTKPQTLTMGPIASLVAIKQLGTNGGSFYNANSAFPLENPTPLTNFIEMLAILLIPAALCYTFGFIIQDMRQGLAILICMFCMFIPAVTITDYAEQAGNPLLNQMGILTTPNYYLYPAGNMEGKETRFGITHSAIWSIATTATSNGSVNSMLDSFTPLGGMMPLWLMHLGEVVFGGTGTGLYGAILLVMITVFMAGLMVGRSPEYLGKRIEPYEMKMAGFAIFVLPLFVFLLTAVAVVTPASIASILNPGAHGFTEILYAFTSMGINNGSDFAGLNANTPFYNFWGGLEMMIMHYGVAIPTLAIAGSMARKKIIPPSAGTLPTYTPLFIILLLITTFILGALTFLPALAVGPIVEHLMMWGAS